MEILIVMAICGLTLFLVLKSSIKKAKQRKENPCEAGCGSCPVAKACAKLPSRN